MNHKQCSYLCYFIIYFLRIVYAHFIIVYVVHMFPVVFTYMYFLTMK